MALHHDTRPTLQPLSDERVGALLGAWQRRELRRASRFRECDGLSPEDLEDIYQDSVVALLGRKFESEEHLRRALHEALKLRALNPHRNRSRRRRIDAYAHGGDRALEHAAEHEQASDQQLLAQQDQLIVREFLTELTEQEGHVFRLLAEGHGWRAAADALGAPRNEIRAAARACERKRERFALLYTTGRLCGYRAHTIQALNSGQTDSETLARRAHAHLQACARCRIEHGTNGERFRRLFDRDALALLPLPVLAQRLSLFSRIAARANRASQHLTAVLTSGGASAKLAVGAASIAVAAGGTIGATQALSHHNPNHATRAQQAPGHPAAPPRRTPVEHALTPTPAPAEAAPQRDAPQRSTTRTPTTNTAPAAASKTLRAAATRAAPLTPAAAASAAQSGASGFAYLGVPHTTTASKSTVHRASSDPRRGGLFSP